MVRAKFKVLRYESQLMSTRQPDGTYRDQEVRTIVLVPVGPAAGGESEENKRFFAATPSGEIRLGVVNASAAAHFVLGAELYVDFTPTEEA